MLRKDKELLDWVGNTYNDYEKSIIKSYKDHGLEGFEYLNKENFIERIKNDDVFAEKWGVSVNRRELTLEERKKIYSDTHIPGFMVEENVWLESKLRAHNIPKQVITLKYNNKTIEIYE